MTYRPREYWERTLSEQFDLRGTGEPGLPLAYNQACYTLRREVLERALADTGFDPRGRRVLDVGCGTGFWTAFYLERGARYLGIDLTRASVEGLTARYPAARFEVADVSDGVPEGPFDVVNAVDVLYHITDDARWAQALGHLARATAPGGVLVLTDLFEDSPGMAEHNRMRSLARYLEAIRSAGVGVSAGPLYPTHLLLNRPLGFWRFLNRAPGLLLAIDRALLARGAGVRDPRLNKLVVLRRTT